MNYGSFVTREAFEALQFICFQSMQFDQLRVYLYGLRYDQYSSTTASPPHQHDFFEFHFITDGEIATRINNIERVYRRGEYYLMTPFVTHNHTHKNAPDYSHTAFTLRWKFETAPCERPNVELNLMRSNLENAIPSPMADKNGEIARAVARMVRLARKGTPGTEVKVLFFEILLALSRRYAEAGNKAVAGLVAPDSVQNILNMAVGYIDAHCGEQIAVGEITRYAHVSYSYLARLFKKYMNSSIVDYIMRVKIDRAQRLLLTTEDSVETLSRALGFSNISHFSNVFKRIMGLSPLKFKAAYARPGNTHDPTIM